MLQTLLIHAANRDDSRTQNLRRGSRSEADGASPSDIDYGTDADACRDCPMKAGRKNAWLVAPSITVTVRLSRLAT
jgi:hypothetical protein